MRTRQFCIIDGSPVLNTTAELRGAVTQQNDGLARGAQRDGAVVRGVHLGGRDACGVLQAMEYRAAPSIILDSGPGSTQTTHSVVLGEYTCYW